MSAAEGEHHEGPRGDASLQGCYGNPGFWSSFGPEVLEGTAKESQSMRSVNLLLSLTRQSMKGNIFCIIVKILCSHRCTSISFEERTAVVLGLACQELQIAHGWWNLRWCFGRVCKVHWATHWKWSSWQGPFATYFKIRSLFYFAFDLNFINPLI